MIPEFLDSQISLRRLLWTMPDEQYNKLFSMTKRHLALVKEAIDVNTLPERKQAIKAEIEALRMSREAILRRYQ